MLKPSSARYSSRPAALRYSVTTRDPGARLVLTHGFTLRPRLTALRATRPAPIMTLGFDVLVQLVIAAQPTARPPCGRPSQPRPAALAAGHGGCDGRGSRSAVLAMFLGDPVGGLGLRLLPPGPAFLPPLGARFSPRGAGR